MCGIAGIWSFRGQIEESVLQSMTDALAHRGPDDSGLYIDPGGRLGLGHRRLSILDLSSLGHQPMSNENGSIWITYNGEVYNFGQIRDELTRKGHVFKSSTDTEVIIKSYEEWGMECVHKFIGMFALGIWDRKENKLILLRDRAGVKPLYYYSGEGVFLFGSELKALMRHPDFRRDIDHDALALYLRYGYVPAPYTIFKNTFKLMPGSYLTVRDGGRLEESTFWDAVDFYLKEPFTASEAEIAEELENLLVDSFKYRLVSDVPVGVFLSGGIDSSLLTALLQKNTGSTLKTFSIGFYESSHNEAEWAQKVADFLGTDHTEYYVSEKEAFETVRKLPEIYDEPFADNSVIPTYLVSKLTRNVAKVALSADGGDELFYGYKRYWHTNKTVGLFSSLPQFAKSAAINGLGVLSPDFVDSIYRTFGFALPRIDSFKDKYSKIVHMLNETNKGEFTNMYKEAAGLSTTKDLREIVSYDYESISNPWFEDTFRRLANLDLSTRMRVTDFRTYLADDILTKLDRATMSVGLEGRDPFLDHRIVEYSARIPADMLYKNGTSKYILRRILYKHVPRSLLERPKQGFNAPLHHWFKKDLSELLHTYLNKPRLEKEGVFDAKAVDSLVKGYLNGASVNINTLWSILIYEMWKEKWLPA